MTTREHIARTDLPVSPERAFAALHTPSAIRQWWGAARAVVLARPGGTWVAAWGADEDAPDYITIATIAVFEPPRRLSLKDFVYYARTGPLPFKADLLTDFAVRPAGTGSVLEVRQSGFPTDPIADEFYAGCERGWRDTLAGIRQYFLTSGA